MGKKGFKVLAFYTPPHVSGGVLCFPAGCPCVRPSVRTYVLSVRPTVSTSFPFDNLSIYQRIFFRLGMCIGLGKISVGIVNGQISMSSDGVIALGMVFKIVFGL